MTKLSDIQTQILTRASAADGGMIDMPTDNKAAVGGLIKRGLMMLIPQGNEPSRLLIIAAGRAAIGLDAQTAEPEPPAPEDAPDPEESEAAAKPKSKGKLVALVELMSRPEGATIEAMMEATGWQAHSVRGAISGSVKKAMGLQITSEKTDGVRVYRVAQEPAA